jgi:hypothetical protein
LRSIAATARVRIGLWTLLECSRRISHEEVAEGVVEPLDVRQHAHGRMVLTGKASMQCRLAGRAVCDHDDRRLGR